jgi:histidinol phosphatase-like enzyme (inositol monophosphatase family)
MAFVRFCGFVMTHPDPSDLAASLSLAHRLADTAGELALRWFRTGVAVDTKSDDSPVTIADREVERAQRALVAANCPGHGIFGEEHGSERADAPWVWVLDPIDGTASFITGSPLWGNLIALAEGGKPVLGIINIPVLAERWVGVRGRPSQRNGDDCRTSGCTRLADARLYATSPDTFDAAGWASFEALSRAVRMRRFGGDCYSYGLLASGHIDLVVETGLKPYDYLPLVPIIEGAGGVLTDWSGQPLHLGSDGRVVAAATPALHREVLAAL